MSCPPIPRRGRVSRAVGYLTIGPTPARLGLAGTASPWRVPRLSGAPWREPRLSGAPWREPRLSGTSPAAHVRRRSGRSPMSTGILMPPERLIQASAAEGLVPGVAELGRRYLADYEWHTRAVGPLLLLTLRRDVVGVLMGAARGKVVDEQL